MSRGRILSLSMFLAIGLSQTAAAANLLSNGSFDAANISGWTGDANVSLAADPMDAESARSSSLKVTNIHTQFNGNSGRVVSHCIQIDPAVTYTIGGMVYVSTSEPNDGSYGAITYKSFATSDCTGTAENGGVSSIQRGSWQMDAFSRSWTGKFSLQVQLIVMKVDKNATFRAYFDNLFIDVARAPSITLFSPTGGLPGNIVSIVGNDLYGLYPQVRFNGVLAPAVKPISSMRMEATVPTGALTGLMSVQNIVGSGNSASKFYMQPVIDSFSPLGGKPHTLVEIHGESFDDAVTVRFGAADTYFLQQVSTTVVRATVPVDGYSGTVQVVTPCPAAGSGPSFVVLPLIDFNADGRDDIVLRNYSTGQNAVWHMFGATVLSITDLPTLPNAAYRIEGTADFNSDGRTDVLLRNYTTGHNAIWLMNGTSMASIVDLPTLTNTDYHIEGTGDFNGDRKPDIIFRNYVSGLNALWLMNGTSVATVVNLPTLANTSYKMESSADFNGDGKLDIVLRNYTTGQNAIWLMNGTAVSSVVDLPALPNTAYRIDGIGDYNGDGRPDIILRNYTNGQNAFWIMNGTTFSAIADFPALPNTAYEINGPR